MQHGLLMLAVSVASMLNCGKTERWAAKVSSQGQGVTDQRANFSLKAETGAKEAAGVSHSLFL